MKTIGRLFDKLDLNARRDQTKHLYEPLHLSAPDIRVLTLLPGKFGNGDIECTLQKTSLNHISEDLNGGYEALSYTWGTSSNRKTIHLDGKRFKVTPNLYDALRYLRHPTQTRCLWVDAICIDQSNTQERTHQVRRMRDIYAGASRVLVWLGAPNEDINKALEFCQKGERTGQYGLDDVFESDKDECASILRGLEQLSVSPWWSRVWVVQEVMVPGAEPLLGSGHKWIEWETFRLVRIALSTYSPLRDPLMRKNAPALAKLDIFSLIEFYAQRSDYQGNDTKHRLDLDSLLIRTADRESHDPKDQVFALLGLLREPSKYVYVDYSLEVTAIYQQAMLDSFRTCGDLDLMLQATGTKKLDLPSWCVGFSKSGWNTHGSELMTFFSFLHGRETFKPGLDLQAQPVHDAKKGQIAVSGKVIGKITKIMPLKGGNHDTGTSHRSLKRPRRRQRTENDQRAWVKWLLTIRIFHTLASESLASRKGQEQAAETIRTGEVWKIAAAGQPFEAVAGFDERLRFESQSPDAESPRRNEVGYSSVEKYLTSHQSLSEEMQAAIGDWLWTLYMRSGESVLFSTDSDYVGMAAHAIEEGDVLCMLYGCSRPVVLRRGGDGAYRLVTYTYTHDVKGGDSVLADAEVTEAVKRLETREFRLR